MQPKDVKTNDRPKAPRGPSVLVVPSKAVHVAGKEDTEISAQIIVPQEGGWGWVVMVTSFTNICLVDGVIFTYGAMFADIRDTLEVEDSMVALVNSVAFGLYFTGGPIASAIINRYGFRECAMFGSIISAIGLLCANLSPNYSMLLLFYGIINGFGSCLINMSSNLVVGFYFESLRSLVLAISGSGSSAGVMILYPVNVYITDVAGWRTVTLLHAGLLGLVYFLSMTYRPLVSFHVTQTTEEEEEARIVTQIPKFHEPPKKGEQKASVTERILKTASSVRYPTAAAVMQEGVVTHEFEDGPQKTSTTESRAKLLISSHAAVNERQFKQLSKFILSHQDITTKVVAPNVNMEIKIEEPPKVKVKWWERCCQWEKISPESRPMYRDDAFYSGKIEKLPEYKKKVLDVPEKARTGFEYQLAVTRTADAEDLKQQKGIFTTAFKRIIVTMIDPSLFKRSSFILLCLSGFTTYLGFLVPYVFLAERNKLQGIHPDHCSKLISIIGLTNLVGRLVLGAVACKLDPLKIYLLACIISGMATIASNFSFDVVYQYICGVIFGLFIASLVSLRSIVLVKLYGIETLTNATGIMVVFQGLASLISTPLGSMIKIFVGFKATFYVAGVFLVVSGLLLIPLKCIVDRENKAQQAQENIPSPSPAPAPAPPQPAPQPAPAPVAAPASASAPVPSPAVPKRPFQSA